MKRYLKYLLKNRAISLILSRAYRPILSVSRFTILVFDGSLRRGYAGDGHAIGRAADIVHAELGAEDDGRRFTAMFATNTDLEVGV